MIDLPPGTGDVQLTLTQQVPLSGGVIVTTPQDVALADVQARRRRCSAGERAGARRDREHELPPLPRAAARAPSSSATAAAQRMARELGIPFLGEVPLVRAIREAGDRGAADRRRRALASAEPRLPRDRDARRSRDRATTAHPQRPAFLQ